MSEVIAYVAGFVAGWFSLVIWQRSTRDLNGEGQDAPPRRNPSE